MIELTDFVHDGTIITLKTPIQLEVTKLNGYYYASNDDLELYGNGSTEDEAIENARNILSELYILSKKVIEYVGGD
jgi:hypothetical protein